MSTIEDALDAAEGPAAAGAEVKRDRWGRPLITPPGSDKAVGYTRCTTFIKALEDTYNLEKWSKRRVARGLALRPDLLLAVQSIADEYEPTLTTEQAKAVKRELDGVCDDAMKAAGSERAANYGTALHRLTERNDRGERFQVPAIAAADIAAYREATAGFRHYFIEQLTVHDDLRVAGTPDRVMLVDGEPVIGDVKTGSIDFSLGTIAMQMAVYSRSQRYNPTTQERAPLTVSQDRGLIIHLPAGKGTCTLVWVDLNAGWEAVQLAAQVRAWRGRRNIGTPYVRPTPLDLVDRIRSAGTPAELSELYRGHRHAWTDEHTAAAKARKAELTGEGA